MSLIKNKKPRYTRGFSTQFFGWMLISILPFPSVVIIIRQLSPMEWGFILKYIIRFSVSQTIPGRKSILLCSASINRPYPFKILLPFHFVTRCPWWKVPTVLSLLGLLSYLSLSMPPYFLFSNFHYIPFASKIKYVFRPFLRNTYLFLPK